VVDLRCAELLLDLRHDACSRGWITVVACRRLGSEI
jgi:hypothetical protein